MTVVYMHLDFTSTHVISALECNSIFTTFSLILGVNTHLLKAFASIRKLSDIG